MRNTHELKSGIRSLAERLDRQSGDIDVDAVTERHTAVRPRPRHTLAVAAAAAVVVAALVVWQLDRGDDRVAITDGGNTDATAPTAPDDQTETGYNGPPPEELPRSGVAVVEDGRLVLLDFEGTEHATADATVAGEVEGRQGYYGIAFRQTAQLEAIDWDNAEAPAGCTTAAGAGGTRVALCDGDTEGRRDIVAVEPTGAARVLADSAPEASPAGDWRWAVPSHDGEWVLAQWSTGCDARAVLIPTAGGEMRTAEGTPDSSDAAPSTAAGWAPDGRAVVDFAGTSACEEGIDEPGSYLVAPDSHERTALRTSSDSSEPASRSYMWRQEAYGSVAEHLSSRALRHLGLVGCCGEPSHGGDAATTGAQWEGVDIPISGVPAEEPPFVPFNDLVIDSEPIEINGTPATAGEADLGAFVAFTCGDYVWALGGAGIGGDRATPEAVRSLAEAFLPHLYCTVGERPQATGHGTP